MALAPAKTLFDEILDFLASSPTAEQLIDYQPPVTLQQHLSALLDKNRKTGLSEDEQRDLDELLYINRFMSRLKLKVRQRMNA